MFQWFRKHTKGGLETPDPTPLEVALKDERPLTLQEQMARFFKSPAVMAAAQARGFDTFDEAEDFGPEDEPEFVSPYEERYDQNGMAVPHVQTRRDEQRQGMVEDFPHERFKKTVDKYRPAKKEAANQKPEALEPKVEGAN